MIKQRLLSSIGDHAWKLMLPSPGLEFDYSQPRGEPALVSPDSVSWRIFKNPVSLYIGGVSAVLLELAEPSVRSGIWDHSSFRRDPVTRLRRTGAAAMMTVYGPRSAAERMIQRINKIHDTVRGTTPEGIEYHANDRRLLDWVQATASYGFIEAYSRYVSHLSDDERNRAFGESAPAAKLYGATGAPRSLPEWNAFFERTRPTLRASEVVHEFLEIMDKTPAMPSALRPLQRLMNRAAVVMLPDGIPEQLGIAHRKLARPESGLMRLAGRTADRIPIRSAPPAQASLRMGMSATALYGS